MEKELREIFMSVWTLNDATRVDREYKKALDLITRYADERAKRFAEFLEKHGYTDSDWREEQPPAFDRFKMKDSEDWKRRKGKFHIRIDHPLGFYSFYDFENEMPHKAEKIAKEQFQRDFCGGRIVEGLETFVLPGNYAEQIEQFKSQGES